MSHPLLLTKHPLPTRKSTKEEKMVRHTPSLSITDTMTEDERSTSKGGFFANWFNSPSRTETRDESDYSNPSGSTDSLDNQYSTSSRREMRRVGLSESFESDTDELDTADEDDLADFDRDLRMRHGQACKYMRVSVDKQSSFRSDTNLQSLTLGHRVENSPKLSKSLRVSWRRSLNASARLTTESVLRCTMLALPTSAQENLQMLWMPSKRLFASANLLWVQMILRSR